MNTRIRSCVFAFILAYPLLLSGCDLEFISNKKQPVMTVDWYLEHKEECAKKVEECGNNPGELSNTPNCKNAMAAALSLSAGESKKMAW